MLICSLAYFPIFYYLNIYFYYLDIHTQVRVVRACRFLHLFVCQVLQTTTRVALYSFNISTGYINLLVCTYLYLASSTLFQVPVWLFKVSRYLYTPFLLGVVPCLSVGQQTTCRSLHLLAPVCQLFATCRHLLACLACQPASLLPCLVLQTSQLSY